jgi:hypothetical protein
LVFETCLGAAFSLDLGRGTAGVSTNPLPLAVSGLLQLACGPERGRLCKPIHLRKPDNATTISAKYGTLEKCAQLIYMSLHQDRVMKTDTWGLLSGKENGIGSPPTSSLISSS